MLMFRINYITFNIIHTPMESCVEFRYEEPCKVLVIHAQSNIYIYSKEYEK